MVLGKQMVDGIVGGGQGDGQIGFEGVVGCVVVLYEDGIVDFFLRFGICIECGMQCIFVGYIQLLLIEQCG